MVSDKVAEALEALTTEIEKLQSQSGLEAYLRFQARFYTYSPANVLLIRVQRPDATQVAGYQRWLDLGRHVRKGEKGIMVLAPVFRRRADLQDDSEDSRPVNFRATYVFDVGQTDPLPGHENDLHKRPDIEVPVLTGEDGAELWEVLLKVAEGEGITVDTADGHGGNPDLMGYYSPRDRRIWIRPAAPLQMTKTLAHELSHFYGCHDESNPNNESMAEGTAYVVLQAFGLDSGQRSVPYICGWDSQKPGAYRGALTGIQRTAKVIIEKAGQVATQPAVL